jgi:hypothetical protein
MSNPTTMNREGWLTAFAEAIAPVIKQRTGHTVPMDRVRLSCSFPRTRATPNKSGSFHSGMCMHGDSHKSGLHELLINPIVADLVTPDKRGIAETVIHELLHASLDKGVGHKAPFARAAKAMGLEGRPTSTTLGPELEKIVQGIVDKIGPYPHKALDGEWGRKQTTRLRKVMCTDCGYINEAGNGYTARITLTWIENAGLPTCPCGATMSLIEKGEEVNIVALKPVESSAHYQVPQADSKDPDPRFQIRRTSSERHGDRWTVIDFGDEAWETSTPRIVSAESKGNALDLIAAIREGLYTWDDLEDTFEDEDVDLGDVPEDDYADEFAKGLFHDVDEDEDPDHPEDQQPEPHVLRKRFNGQWRDVPVEFEYDVVAASREVQ